MSYFDQIKSVILKRKPQKKIRIQTNQLTNKKVKGHRSTSVTAPGIAKHQRGAKQQGRCQGLGGHVYSAGLQRAESAALELVGARKHALAPSSGHRPKYSRTVTQTQGFLGVKVSPEVL